MTGAVLPASRPASDLARYLPGLVLGLGVLPSIWTAWILWAAPVDGLTADRAALAARDFTALWAAGKIAGEHAFATLSDPAAFTAYLRALFGPGMPSQIWPYPPVILLLARPLSEAPLVVGMVAYTVLCLAALAAVLRANRLSAAAVAAVLLSPAVAVNALVGQNGTLIAALLAGGLLLVERRPVIAGLLLGALCIKPQFALLMPVCLLAGHHRRALAASCTSAALLTLSSSWVFGYKPWVDFLSRDRTTVTAYVGAPWQAEPAQTLFSSVFMAARSIGLSVTNAYVLQGIATACCVYLAWRLWSGSRASLIRRVTATIPLVLLAAPWVHLYDMPALSIVVVLLLQRGPGFRRALLGFAWLWPNLAEWSSVAPVISVLTVSAVAWTAIATPDPERQPLSP